MKTTLITVLLICAAWSTHAQDSKLKTEDLPKIAREFLSTHFGNDKIVKVKKEWQIGEKGYEVELENGTEIEFTNSGHWREVDGNGNAIPTAYILDEIVNYVKEKYPMQKITHVDIGHKDVDIDLSNNTDLDFTQDGKFLKSRQK